MNPQVTHRVRVNPTPQTSPVKTYPELKTRKDYYQFKVSEERSINNFTTTRKNIPVWCQANQYIFHGYRRPTNTFMGCILSLTYQHNELGNVYTHLIGFMIVVQYSYYLIFDKMYAVGSTTVYDYLAHLSFLTGLMICLACSTIFHLCCCHSKHIMAWFNKADYIGIVCLQVGSFIPILYYGFYCDTFFKAFYCIAFVLLGIFTIGVTVAPNYATSEYRWLRVGVFTLLGLSGIIPIAHLTWRYGWKMVMSSTSVNYILLEGLIYFTGAFIYAKRIPECYFPDGIFDIWGHSHQIWHIFVLAAAFYHYLGVVDAYNWWHTNNPVCQYSDFTMMGWFN